MRLYLGKLCLSNVNKKFLNQNSGRRWRNHHRFQFGRYRKWCFTCQLRVVICSFQLFCQWFHWWLLLHRLLTITSLTINFITHWHFWMYSSLLEFITPLDPMLYESKWGLASVSYVYPMLVKIFFNWTSGRMWWEITTSFSLGGVGSCALPAS